MAELDTSSLKLLLLDDDPDDRLIFRDLVEDLGALAPELRTAAGCGEAGAMLEEQRFDACFVDYRLGPESGLDFIREQSGRHPEVPFILLTGQGGTEVDEQALRAGAKLYLQKGEISSPELLRCVRYTVAQTRNLILVRNQRQVVNDLLESLDEVLWIFDLDAKMFLEMGPGIEAISGQPAAGILKDPNEWTRLMKDGHGPILAKLTQGVEPGASEEFEYVIEDLQGEEHLIREHAYRMKTAAGQDWLVGILRDVTAEQASQSELLLMREMIHQVEDAVLITDNQLDAPGGPHILFANPAFLEMTGYTMEEVIGRSPKLLQGPKTSRLVLDALKQALKKGEDFSAETVNYRKDGSEYHVRWSITPVRDAEGEVAYYASIQRDVTEEILEREQRMRAQRLESLGNMVGGIAHDLNNILSPILMGAGLLDSADDPELRSSITKSMVESAERAGSVVGKLLTFARGGSSEKAYVNPKGLMEEVHKIIEEAFPRQIDVQLKIDEDLWTAYCSPTEIQQVLMNLVINAKDSMEEQEGGTLTLAAENLQVNSLQAENFGMPGGGPCVLIRVEDTGTGMSPEVMERVFDPFYTTKEEGKGTGLGLPSSLGIVREHEGGIDVQSEPGRGTIFSVFLPAFPEQESEEKVKDHSFERGKGQHILVVDDEPSITHLVCEMLEEYGYRAKGVTSSREALKYFRDHAGEFDAMITDMMMPEMDGLALCDRVLEQRPDLPVMVMTGYVHHDKLERLKQNGIERVLTKPVRLETLMRQVNRLLENSRPRVRGW